MVEPTAVTHWALRWRLALAWSLVATLVIAATGGGQALASVL